MGILLFVLAVICIVAGVVNFAHGAVLFGVLMIVLGLILGGAGSRYDY